MNELIELDEKDIKLLELLASNARTTYIDMARAIGISDVAVMKRVKRLESKLIKRYTIVVDPRKLGFKIVSLTGIDIEPDKLFNILESLKNRNDVKGLWLTTGDHTLMAVIWARNENEIAKIHNDISMIPGVRRVCPAIILKTLKDLDMGFAIE